MPTTLATTVAKIATIPDDANEASSIWRCFRDVRCIFDNIADINGSPRFTYYGKEITTEIKPSCKLVFDRLCDTFIAACNRYGVVGAAAVA